MSSPWTSERRSIGILAAFIADMPAILACTGVYLLLNWEIVRPMPDEFGIAGLFTACLPTLFLGWFARPGHATHWIAYVLVIAVATSLAALSTAISGLFFRDLIMAVDSLILAGMLYGSPGVLVGPLSFWVLHRLAGDSSPWKLDEA